MFSRRFRHGFIRSPRRLPLTEPSILAVLDRIETFAKPPLPYNGPDTHIREEGEDHMMAEQNRPDALERRRRLRTGLIVSALLGIVLLATACAGGPSGPGVAGQGASSTPSASPSSDTGNAELAHAQCMRDHGISDFPDPQAGGGSAIQFQPGSDLDPDNPQYEAAEDACKSLLPPPSSSIWTPSPQELEQLVRFAQCMRAHGADVSDPDPTTGDMTTPHGTRAEAENDPLYQAAYAACKDKLPDEAQAPEKNR
jgi:hypothetical protein